MTPTPSSVKVAGAKLENNLEVNLVDIDDEVWVKEHFSTTSCQIHKYQLLIFSINTFYFHLRSDPMADEVIAYLLILTTSEGTENLLGNLRAMPEVTEAFVIYGDWDLIVRVKVGSLPELTKFVMELRKNKAIRKTSTLIALMEE